jgi:hypothetical protein
MYTRLQHLDLPMLNRLPVGLMLLFSSSSFLSTLDGISTITFLSRQLSIQSFHFPVTIPLATDADDASGI